VGEKKESGERRERERKNEKKEIIMRVS